MNFISFERRLEDLEERVEDSKGAPGGEDSWLKFRQATLSTLDDFPGSKRQLLDKLKASRQEKKNFQNQEEEWQDLRAFILEALESFPEARAGLLAAWEKLGV